MSEILYAYWQGFTASGTSPDDSPTLALTPPFVDIVALAFAAPGPGSTIDTSYLTSQNSKESILADARVLQARGQKVVMSVNESSTVPWPTLAPTIFAKNVKLTAEEWGLDGLDLDDEVVSSIPGQEFVDLIKAIRDTMGGEFIISYPGFLEFRDGFLPKVKDELTLVCTMAYWNEFSDAVSLYETYAAMVGHEKVCIGVKPGQGYNDQHTPIEAVPQLASYQPKGATKAGMMLYSLSLDTRRFTGKPQFYWTELVHQHLSTKP